MGFLFASMKKDLARWRQDKTALLIWLGIPFMLGGLITLMIDGGGGSPSGVLLIADEDNTVLSGLVASAYSQDQFGDLIIVEQVTPPEGELRINKGGASAYLLIPGGFQDAFINETPVTLVLKTNPSQTILPGIIRDVTEILLDAGFYAQRLFGAEIKQIQDSIELDSVSDVLVSDIAVEVQNKFSSIDSKIFPPLLDVVIVEPPPAEPQPDMALLFLPGIILMAILFSSNSIAADFWVEREKGTLRRLASAPGLLARFVAGKALAAFAVIGFLAIVTMLIGFSYHGVAWSKFVPSLLWVTIGGVGLFAWFSALQMLFPNNKSANLVTTILLFPLMMAGGSFFPLAALPDWIAGIGRLSPNGYIVDRLSIELTASSAWSIEARSWLTLLIITVLGLALSTLRLRTGFANR